MELWTEVRRRVLTGEISRRQACDQYELHWQTLKKILGHVEPPGYRRATSRQRPKMERFLPLIAEILVSDAKA
ncbi:MAG: IS21 family transposase, partial [Pirellulales bacterium]|nr:IS21 family transposase [Pirellulales bacterium]